MSPLPPQLATRLNRTGRYDAIHPLYVGRRGEPYHRVLQRCIGEDRVIVTENARNFRRLIGKADIHAGLILSALDREGSWRLLQRAIAYLEGLGAPADVMVNHALEVGETSKMNFFELSRR